MPPLNHYPKTVPACVSGGALDLLRVRGEAEPSGMPDVFSTIIPLSAVYIVDVMQGGCSTSKLKLHRHTYSETSIVRTPLGSLLAVLYSETSIIRTPLGPLLAVLYSETSVMRTPLGSLLTVLFSETSVIGTPLGPLLTVLLMQVSLFRQFGILMSMQGMSNEAEQ